MIYSSCRCVRSGNCCASRNAHRCGRCRSAPDFARFHWGDGSRDGQCRPCGCRTASQATPLTSPSIRDASPARLCPMDCPIPSAAFHPLASCAISQSRLRCVCHLPVQSGPLRLRSWRGPARRNGRRLMCRNTGRCRVRNNACPQCWRRRQSSRAHNPLQSTNGQADGCSAP